MINAESYIRELQNSDPIVIGAVEIRPLSMTVLVNSGEIDLTSREFDLLRFLMMNAGRVVSRADLNEYVWGGTVGERSNTIDVSVCHVRTKIGDTHNRIIRSIRGVGYFFAKN